jgi:hypothetical protein
LHFDNTSHHAMVCKETRRQRAKRRKRKSVDPTKCPLPSQEIIQIYRRIIETIEGVMIVEKRPWWEKLEMQWQVYGYVKHLPVNEKDFYVKNTMWIDWTRDIENVHGNKCSELEYRTKKEKYNYCYDSGCGIQTVHRGLLCRTAPDLLMITALAVKGMVKGLYLSGFDNVPIPYENNSQDTRPLHLEDVLQIFSKAGYWTTSLQSIRFDNCHMNAVGDDFKLEGTYPECLKHIYIGEPSNLDGMMSSTIFELSSQSTCFQGFFNYPQFELDRRTLTNAAWDRLLDVLSTVDTLCMDDDPLFLTNGSEDDFQIVLKALTTGHTRTKVTPAATNETKLLDRWRLLDLYMRVNQYRSIFSGAKDVPLSMVPLVLEHCLHKNRNQEQHDHDEMIGSRQRLHNQQLFYLLRERVDWLIVPRQNNNFSNP